MTAAELESLAERIERLPESERKRRQAISDTARRLREGGGFIYVASWKCGQIKIGCAANVANRMKTLKIDSRLAVEPRLLASMPGTVQQERQLHRVLRRFLRKSHLGCDTEVYPASILLHPAIPEPLRVSL